MADVGVVTRLLHAWRAGDPSALDRLVPIVYEDLRQLAAAYLRHERSGHTFRPTDLVSEAYLRLCDGATPELNDRVHFFAVAARTMRRILVDHARMKGRDKRGAGDKPITLDERIVAPERPQDLLALDAALEELAVFDERKARAIELHYFAGLGHQDVAIALDVHINTVGRDLRLAEAWLHQRLSNG